MGNWKGIDPAQWAAKAKLAMRAVRNEAAQELAEVMGKTIPNGGDVPAVTGNLSRSVVLTVGTRPSIKESDTFTTQDFGAALLGAGPEDTIYLGYQAAYARRQNYGFVGTDSLGRTYNQAGYGFAEKAAAQWPAIVERSTLKVRHRMAL